MIDMLNRLFDPSGLTPHGFCLAWQPGLIWLHAASDLCIACAYYSIPIALLVVVRRRGDIVYPWMFWLFAAFITACGTTHAIGALTLWVPAYWIEGVMKALTAILSIATACLLLLLVPKILALPSQAELRRLNAQLAQSESRYRGLFTRAPACMHSLNADRRIVDVSDAWLALLGYTRGEVVGQLIDRFEEAPLPVPRGADPVECRLRRSSGEVLDVLVSHTIEDETGPDRQHGMGHAICVLTDLTARKRAEAALHESEQRLRQTEKLTALGQLAGGIAHDFNNILQAVHGGASLIRKRAADPTLVCKLADMVKDAAKRGASVSRRLLVFARQEELRAEPIDVPALMNGLQELLTHTLGGGVAITLDMAPALPRLQADRGQMETVLVNLATNARDAMPDGGAIILRARVEQVVHQGALPPGVYLALAVIDRGVGMDAATLARATEPFFTTKANGRGTGLGLSMARGFAEESGGILTLSSTPGQGTTAELWLPASGAAEPPAPPPPPMIRHQAAHLLVVDDDASVREVIADQLAEHDFLVLQAESGPTALSLLEAGERVDLLISDLAMPTMDGVTLIHAAQRCRPGLPALLLTGFAATAESLAANGGFTVLRKPIGVAALVDEARRALGPLVRA